jgi:hypothetical protein
MTIVAGFDVHRAQITFDARSPSTLLISRQERSSVAG